VEAASGIQPSISCI